jgi:hypothetical protein
MIVEFENIFSVLSAKVDENFWNLTDIHQLKM